DLKAPEPVKGHFTQDPPFGSLVAKAYLVKNIPRNPTFAQIKRLVAPPTRSARIDTHGNFAFAPLAQGTYDLLWGFTGGFNGFSIEAYFTVTDTSSGAPFYVATVEPLCTFDFGDIEEPVIPPSALP